MPSWPDRIAGERGAMGRIDGTAAVPVFPGGGKELACLGVEVANLVVSYCGDLGKRFSPGNQRRDDLFEVPRAFLLQVRIDRATAKGADDLGHMAFHLFVYFGFGNFRRNLALALQLAAVVAQAAADDCFLILGGDVLKRRHEIGGR